MANTPFIRGLVPEPTPGQMPLTKVYTAETTNALFIGSPVYLSSGVVTAAAVSNTGDDTVLIGTVVALRDANGLSRCNKAASTAGFTAEVTFDPNQIYRITISGADIGDNNVGGYLNILAETATADTATTEGHAFSKCQASSTTDTVDDGVLQIIGFTNSYGNTKDLTGVEVFVKVCPAAHQLEADA